MKTFVQTLALFCLIGLGSMSPASADSQKTLFYNLTSDDTWTAGMALGQAAVALHEGYEVDIFLNVRAVLLAARDFHSDAFSASGKTLQTMLKDLMAKGAKVYICPMCMHKAGLTKDDLIPNVQLGNVGKGVLRTMTAEGTTVVSY